MKTSDLRLLVLVGVLVTPISAQTLPPSATGSTATNAATEPVVELSPFVISSSADTGWIATETLAGSRLRTDFKDVPNQIETLTKDFMQDLGMTNMEQALIYTANVENLNDQVPPTTGTGVDGPTGSGRVRGIGTGTLTRNFFKVSNSTDNYNVERATIASGPNAILFGLGSPAGIFDATPARALLTRNKYGFEVQGDSERSRRATFDANLAVRPQTLAVRLMGLSKREFTEKQPNLDRDDRLYAALTFKPFKYTTLVVQGERDKRNYNRAGRSLPTDFVGPWFIANQVAGSGYAAAKPIFDNSSLTGIGTNRIFAQGGANPVVIQGGSGPTQSWLNSVTVRSPGTLPGVDQTFDAGGGFTILDPAIFPFDVNIVGSGRTTVLGGYTKTVILEQRLADSLFLEIGYNREDSYQHQLSAGSSTGGADFALQVDANRFIPGTTTPNPNVGQIYYQGSASSSLTYRESDDWRASLSYELDLARKFGTGGGWRKWTGRHRFAGFYSITESNTLGQQEFVRRILDEPTIPGVTLTPKTTVNWATAGTRTPAYRHYFTNPYQPKVAAGPMTGDWTMTDANGRPYTLYQFDTPLRSATSGKRLAANQAASGNLNYNTAMVFAWQGFFLPDRERRDRLVLTYGYRKDTAKSATLDPASTTIDFSGLYPVLWDAQYGGYGPEQWGINRNTGVVLRPFRWVSVFYNHSTTFDLNIGRYDPFGEEIPGAGGKGKDYGLRLDLWGDRVSLRLNRYENTIGPQRASNQINQYRDVFFNIEQRVLTLDPTVPTINVNDGNTRGYRAAGRPNYFIMSDSESSGYEAELNFAPTRAWNLRVNGAKSEAMESNIGLPWYTWHDARLPVWQAVIAKNGERDASGQPVTWRTAPYNVNQPAGQTIEQYYTNTLIGQAFAFMKAADGRATSTARGSRANAIANYRFSEGWLKGVNVGGAFRWRSAPTVGYGVKTSAGGATVLDLDRTYKGKAEKYIDFLAGYRGKLRAFGGYNYRVQLNIRNLLNEHDPVPAGALTTGVISRLATIDRRVFVATFGVDF